MEVPVRKRVNETKSAMMITHGIERTVFTARLKTVFTVLFSYNFPSPVTTRTIPEIVPIARLKTPETSTMTAVSPTDWKT
jgi:hypothetical protein